jgi:hypothetical protein
MAHSQNPLSGQMTGSVANFVTSSRNGQNEIRSKAFNPRNANTPAQQMQRTCFKLVGDEFQTFGGIPNEGFPERPSNQSGYNQFMAANLPAAIDKSGADPVIDYSKLVVANGTLPQVVVTGGSVNASGISITYQTNVKIPKINADDVVVVVAKTQIGELLYEKATRTDALSATILIDYPGIRATDIKCCYLFVLSADGTRASKSVYVPLV